MAERRMFAKTIIDSDAFLDMPVTARLLYYDLAMRADDDGFVNSPKKIMRMIGASQDDISVLILRKFILPFDNGVVVIKHWRIHNYIRKDTYNETTYKEQKALLDFDENRAYTFNKQACIQTVDEPWTERGRAVDEPSTQVSIGKVSLGKDRLEKSERGRFAPPTPEEVKAYAKEADLQHVDADAFLDYYQQQGWKLSNGTAMKDWKAAARNWNRREAEFKQKQQQKQRPSYNPNWYGKPQEQQPKKKSKYANFDDDYLDPADRIAHEAGGKPWETI